MRILVTGSRDWADPRVIGQWLMYYSYRVHEASDLVVVHGACPIGADQMADDWAGILGLTVEAHPAKGHPTQDFGPWPGAGPNRNRYMVSLGADLCLAFISECTSPRCGRVDSHYSHGASGTAALAAASGIMTRRFHPHEGH